MTNLPLEKQVTSLELSMRIKKLGVPQKSLFYWLHLKPKREYRPVGYWKILPRAAMKRIDGNETVSAFTVSELADWQKNVDEPQPWYANGSWWYYEGENPVSADTQANAYAKRGIYLLENNLIPNSKEV